jgi:hypothetical protein
MDCRDILQTGLGPLLFTSLEVVTSGAESSSHMLSIGCWGSMPFEVWVRASSFGLLKNTTNEVLLIKGHHYKYM